MREMDQVYIDNIDRGDKRNVNDPIDQEGMGRKSKNVTDDGAKRGFFSNSNYEEGSTSLVLGNLNTLNTNN